MKNQYFLRAPFRKYLYLLCESAEQRVHLGGRGGPLSPRIPMKNQYFLRAPLRKYLYLLCEAA